MNDLQGQRDVTPYNLPQIVVCNNNELTSNAAKNIDANPFESKSKDANKFEEFLDIQDSNKLYQENLIVTKQEVLKDDSEVSLEKSPPRRDVLATSEYVTKEALTLGDIISMDSSQNHHSNNIYGPEETDNLRYFSTEMAEQKNPLLNNGLEESFDHNLFSRNFTNGFKERSFSEEESCLGHITYSGPVSVSGNLSVRSDGSTVSARSFAFPILEQEWNSSPVRMVKADKKLRKDNKWRHYSLLLCCRF
ncbi:unnamed protein product [Cochlearia groenlandica]